MEALKVRSEIVNLIKNVCEDHGINNHEITDVKTNQKGEGYLGEIFMVTVKDRNSEKTLDFLVKAAFESEKIRQVVPIKMTFQNEIYFYMKVYPSLQNFAKECGVHFKEIVPKCYRISAEEGKEMLALENLKMSGFEVFDKKAMLDHDHMKLIFETYGRFHALSFALKDQEPKKYEKLVENFHNIYAEFMSKNMFTDHLTELSKLVQSMLLMGEDDEIIKKFEKYREENVATVFGKIVTDEDLDYSCILHGDCWSNNMMFKYEKNDHNEKLTDMRLIDWQLMKVGSPVCDLSYCLYSGASQKIFDNLNEYLLIYHDSFSSFARQLGSDSEKIFPFAVLKEHWRKYSKFGMIMTFSILKMKLTQKEDLIDLTDDIEMDQLADAFVKTKFNEEDYRKRIRGLLWHMSELDAL